MGRAIVRRLGLAVAFAITLGSTPVLAQMSDGFNFLKAVKERDGNKATDMLNQPGSTLIDSRDSSTGETALHIAVARRDALWTRFLLDKGADPNIADRKGVTPLSLAVNLGFPDGVDALIAKRARIDSTNDAGETPLIAAVHRRDVAMIRLLMKGGANPDRSDNSGRSARDYAQLMGASAGITSEIDRAEADRKAAPALKTYGPIIQ